MFQVSFPQVFYTESEKGSHLETLVEVLYKVFYRVPSLISVNFTMILCDRNNGYVVKISCPRNYKTRGWVGGGGGGCCLNQTEETIE